MSNEVETSFVQQYTENVTLLTQQKGSKLRQYVDIEPINGEFAYVEQIGQTAAKVKESRHGDTPVMNTPHGRRRLQLIPYEWGDLIDTADKVRMLIDPTSPYAMAAAMTAIDWIISMGSRCAVFPAETGQGRSLGRGASGTFCIGSSCRGTGLCALSGMAQELPNFAAPSMRPSTQYC